MFGRENCCIIGRNWKERACEEFAEKGSFMNLRKKMKLDYYFWWKILPFIGLAVWGVFSITSNLWYDEAYSASLVSLPWIKLVYITAVDDHSPFYYTLLKLFYHLGGGGTHFWILKGMSLCFIMAYLLLGMFYVKKLFGEKISVYFMLFSILMPIMTVQAGNVRMYTLGLFCVTLALLSAYDVYQAPTKKKWVVFCIASVCSVYCHTFAMFLMFFLYVLFFGVLLYQKKYKELKGFFLSGIIVSILYSPWLLVTFHQMQLRIANDSGSRSAEAIPTIYTFMDYCKEWFSALETPIPIVIFLGMAIIVVLGYYAVDWMRANHNYAPGIGMAVVGLTVLTGTLISIFINPCFMGRYVFPGFGALALFYAVGASKIESRKVKTVIFAAATVCFLLQYRSELALEYDTGLDIYEEFIEEKVGKEDCIIGPYEHTIFLNVYHPELQYYLYGYKLYSLPFVNTEAFTEWQQLEGCKGNIWYICFAGDTPDRMTEYYSYTEEVRFHYMYYDFVIYHLIPKS